MEHWILRCKHCNKEYTYCTYGNGPEYGTEEGCSQEYCAECQRAIDEALSRIPVKYRPISVEVKDETLLETLDQIKKRYADKIVCVKMVGDKYDNVEEYKHDGKTFYVKYDDDNKEDKHLFVEKTYDIMKDKVIDKYWRAFTHEDYYSLGRSLHSVLTRIKDIPIQNLPEPDGKIFWDDFFF